VSLSVPPLSSFDLGALLFKICVHPCLVPIIGSVVKKLLLFSRGSCISRFKLLLRFGVPGFRFYPWPFLGSVVSPFSKFLCVLRRFAAIK